MRMIKWFCRLGLVVLHCFIMIPLYAQLGTNILPLRGEPLLSGNFGELRATHFHSGIDLKTGGTTGLPVLCVNDGVIARIRISASGYGNALYVEHPDGMTTVYGHLDRFNGKIRKVARELQYRNESFELDENVRELGLIFRKGDTIAYSGNTGASGGPHLHFEYRDTKTENILNPLRFIAIQDHVAPNFRKLYVYESDPAGRLIRRRCDVKALGKGRYDAGRIKVSAGCVGVGAYITDVMDGSWNKLGVYKLTLRSGQAERFRLVVDTGAFDKAPLVNDLKDFELYRERSETVYRCFGNYIDWIPGISCVDNGYLTLNEGEEAEVELEAEDISGNSSVLRCVLVGGKQHGKKEGKVLEVGRVYHLKAGPYVLELDSCSLFTVVDSIATVDSAGVFVTARQDVPLWVKALLRVEGEYWDARMVLARLNAKGQWEALKTMREGNGLCAWVNMLGKYTLLIDSVPPRVEYGGMINGSLKFTIKDELAGIREYRGEVNGRWCLFEYDAKTGTLTCRKNEPAFVKGQKNRVLLTVTDAVGNKTRREIIVN